MCDCTGISLRTTRRRLLFGGGVALGASLLSRPSAALALDPVHIGDDLQIVPRSDWGPDLPVVGTLTEEALGDVRFLLVHHTASSNDYGPEATVGYLRSFYDLHTGENGWADVAYNFFVDRHGVVYEARTGSLHGPVKGDATGGSQGFALLCCFVGDHSVEPPTLAAHTSMIRLLAWLADRYQIETAPGATATFVSRGSNLHPTGTEVSTPTIAGHRDMSQTVCPGDAAYAVVRNNFQAQVTQRRSEVAAAMTTTTSTTTTTTVPPSTTLGLPSSGQATHDSVGPDTSATDGSSLPAFALGVVGVGAAALGVTIGIRRRRKVADDVDSVHVDSAEPAQEAPPPPTV